MKKNPMLHDVSYFFNQPYEVDDNHQEKEKNHG